MKPLAKMDTGAVIDLVMKSKDTSELLDSFWKLPTNIMLTSTGIQADQFWGGVLEVLLLTKQFIVPLTLEDLEDKYKDTKAPDFDYVWEIMKKDREVRSLLVSYIDQIKGLSRDVLEHDSSNTVPHIVTKTNVLCHELEMLILSRNTLGVAFPPQFPLMFFEAFSYGLTTLGYFKPI
jgi:hypothetical protein